MASYLRLADGPDDAPEGAEASAEEPIRVVLADDHERMRRSLRMLLDGTLGSGIEGEI